MIGWMMNGLRRAAGSQDGVVAIQMAVSLAALMGMAGLATDVGLVLYEQRQMQAAADSAAFSAALAKSTGYPTAFATEAYAVAGQDGFVNGANLVNVAVHSPPVSPPATAADAANANAVQVIITKPQSPFLASLVHAGTFNISAQAVAGSTTIPACSSTSADSPCTCILTLNKTANPAVTISNGATVDLKACGMQICSSGAAALTLSGGAQLNLENSSGTNLTNTSQDIAIVGGASVSNGATNNGHGSCFSCVTTSACTASADPYSKVPNQTSPGGCSLGTGTNYPWHAGNPAYTLNPGVWCSGVTFGQGLTYKLNPGVYYVNGGTFNVGGGATLTGTGVTIVLTGSGSNYANVNIGNGSTVNLTAPTSGATSGIAFFGDENAPSSTVETFQGGASIKVTGAMYFPTDQVILNNGVSNPSSCTQLIAGTVQFQGGANFSRSCSGAGTTPIGTTSGPVMMSE